MNEVCKNYRVLILLSIIIFQVETSNLQVKEDFLVSDLKKNTKSHFDRIPGIKILIISFIP